MFSMPITVYYEDTDATGVVYHANYLRYFERARTEWLRSLGFSQQALTHSLGLAFTISRLNVDYLRPARLDDRLTVTATIGDCRRASLVFEQTLTRDVDGVVLARGQARAACVDVATFRPRPLPDALRQALGLSQTESMERSTA